MEVRSDERQTVSQPYRPDDEPTRAYRPGSDDATRVYRQPDARPAREDAYAASQAPYRPAEQRPPTPSQLRRAALDPAALWSGGVVTAVVAALVALAGIIVIRGILKIGILTSLSVGTFGDAKTIYVVVVAFLAGLVATGLLHALVLTTPQPLTFFGWIAGLVTVIVALLPLTTTAPWEQKLATVVLDVVIGLVIGGLLTGAARRARRDPHQNLPPARR